MQSRSEFHRGRVKTYIIEGYIVQYAWPALYRNIQAANSWHELKQM